MKVTKCKVEEVIVLEIEDDKKTPTSCRNEYWSKTGEFLFSKTDSNEIHVDDLDITKFGISFFPKSEIRKD